MSKNIITYIVFLIVIVLGLLFFMSKDKKIGTTSISFYPNCVIDEKDLPNSATGVKEWTTDSRKVEIKCQDKDNNCEKEKYEATFNDDNLTDYIMISDTDGNKKKCYVTTYIDKTNPNIEIKFYKVDEDLNKTGRPVGTFSSRDNKIIETKDITDNINGYLNKEKYPYGIYVEVIVNDNLSLKNYTYEELEDNKYLVKDKKKYQDKQTNKEKILTSDTMHYIINHEGKQNSRITITDGANHTATIDISLLLDRTPPTIPIVKMYKWKDNDTKPKDSNGLTEYISNDWSSKPIYVVPNSSKDNLSSNITYLYSSQGTTTTYKDYETKTKNIASQGISRISFKACDEANNCSIPSPEQIIKIDRTGPYFDSVIESSNKEYNAKTINYTIKSKDALSESKKYCISTDKECIPNQNINDNKKIEVTNYDLKINYYDGTSKKIYICVSDKVDNTICHSTEYTVYKKCSTTKINETCNEFSSCICNEKKQYADKLVTTIDKNLNIICDSKTKPSACAKKCSC